MAVVFYGILGSLWMGTWGWALVKVAKMPGDAKFRSGTRRTWIALIGLTGCVGAIIYVAAGRPRFHRAWDRSHPPDHIGHDLSVAVMQSFPRSGTLDPP